MSDVRSRSYRARTKYAWDIIARRLKKLRAIVHRNPTDEWAFEWTVLESLENATFEYLEAWGVDGDLWPYYVGYVKQVWERMMKFTDQTLALEIQSLQNEYVLRGLALPILEGLIQVALYHYQWKQSGQEEDPMYLSRVSAYLGSPFLLGSGSFTIIPLDREDYDPLGEMELGALATFTPKSEGYYFISGAVGFENPGAGITMGVMLGVNGINALHQNFKRTVGGQLYEIVHATALGHILTTDEVRLFGYQNSGGNLNVATARPWTHLYVHRLS